MGAWKCTLALTQMHPCFHHSTLTKMMPHSLCVYLLHIYHSLLVLSANCSFIFFMNWLCDIVFTGLTSDQHVCNVLQILSVYSACTCTLLPMGLLQTLKVKNSSVTTKVNRLSAHFCCLHSHPLWILQLLSILAMQHIY